VNARADRFPLFDSLRAIAALSVLATHCAVFGISPRLRPYGARLEAGVAIFFVISGFLLYRPFAKSRLFGDQAPRTVAYAWRRFLRIVPAYWVALTVLGLTLGVNGLFGSSDVPLLYGFAQTWKQSTIGSGLSQAWTLCIEITFYAFLPLWAWAMRQVRGGDFEARLRGEVVALTGLFCVSVAYKVAILASGTHKVVITPQLDALPSFLDQFALGMGLAVLSLWIERRGSLPLPRGLSLIDRFPSIPWIVALVAFWAANTRLGLTGQLLEPFTPAQYLGRHLLYAVIGLGIVMPAVIGETSRGVVRRILANRMLLYLGLISYGIYLYSPAAHQTLERLGFSPNPPFDAFFLWLPATAVVAIAFATASYYVVERPALSLKRLIPIRPRLRGEAIAEPAPAAPPAQQQG
jgi:peptidoglycan/LPS O-acetylase OafA/YrhL